MLAPISRWLLIVLLVLPISAWALEPEAQAAKNEGMRLYNIGHSTAAMPYLRQAAEAGDVEAMYYMGEAERRQQMMGLTRAAMEWYLKAAAEGDAYSMLQLFRGGACTAGDRCPEGFEDWHHAALAITQPQAEAGDPDAMLAMYHIQRMFEASRRAGEWLERAAEAGQPEAQTLLGRQILSGRGWYLTNGRRVSAAEEWFRRAAEQGYVPAMNELASVLANLERYEDAWYWYVQASDNGHINGRQWLGNCYMEPERDSICQVDQDLVKGWTIYYAIDQEVDGTSSRRSLQLRRELISDAERREAEELAGAEWIGREPPLSRFPPRFGY
ncbi:tetratricopeptide repeat protein [Halomonas sp. H5]|uniref:tetratricopeptide repeat protein n=1 Tax=Halomonas sp. H5 TaxID=3423910 RepID=UPI003D36E44E